MLNEPITCMQTNTVSYKDLKAGDRELVKGGGALLTGGCVQIKWPMQRRLGGPLIGGLLDRPI